MSEIRKRESLPTLSLAEIDFLANILSQIMSHISLDDLTDMSNIVKSKKKDSPQIARKIINDNVERFKKLLNEYEAKKSNL